MKKTVCFLLFALLIGVYACAGAEKNGEYPSMPEALQFTQRYKWQKPRNDTTLVHLYPTTSRSDVDAELAGLMAEMESRAADLMPTGKKKKEVTRLTVGPQIGRSGEKWMSFLTLCTVSRGHEQVYVDFDARAYDMETGQRLSLTDLFAPESEAWALLAREVRAQLTAYFITEQPDEAALDALCTREAIEQAPFTFTAGTLMLHYRADALYPGHSTLMHVRLLFPSLWEMMTEEARVQTDNRRYKLVALTFDDGCAKIYSLTVANRLCQYGANATFFVVGDTMQDNQHVLSYEHDLGFTIGSHNYKHQYDNLDHDMLLSWKELFDETMDAIIGVRPAMMRAPGGIEKPYIRAGVNLPLIHWDVISGDAEKGKTSLDISTRVINVSRDGSIVLMHDANEHSDEYLSKILPTMQARGWVFVSVEELMALRGVELVPGYIYYSANSEPQTVE